MTTKNPPAPFVADPEESSPPAVAPSPEKDEKLRKREAKLLRDATRPLNGWERYRALLDTLDEGQWLIEIADRKARFALVVMGALNVVLFLLATRIDLVELIPDALRAWIGVYLVVYAAVAVYFFMQAIEALRPRRFRPHVEYPGPAGPDHHPLGIRYFEDVILRDVEAYRRAWRDVRVSQLNAELAVQAHVLARTNQDKYQALRRLFAGLRAMTLLAAGMVTVLAFSVFQAPPKLKSGKPSRGGLNVLGTPVRIADSGAREPSGVAYHPKRDRLYVVGDEGRLVELDTAGRPQSIASVKGNLEDVVVHAPSGSLAVLVERPAALVWYDPAIRQETRRWKLDREGLLGEPPADKNLGFEGLAFREDASRPGGGVFFLVHQRLPAMVVSVAFDPASPGDRLGAEAVIDRWSFKQYGDLTAATFAPSLDRLLVIAEGRDRMLVLRLDGTLQAEVVLPGLKQEGLSFDGEGHLWVADDRGGLLRFDGALASLARALAPQPFEPAGEEAKTAQ